MRDGRCRRAAVARGGRHEDARTRRVEERHLDGIEEVGAAAADRIVDHVHAIRHGLIDGGHVVGREAGSTRAGFPAGLVGGNAGARRDAGYLGAEYRDRPGDRYVGVAARGRGGVGTVATEIARGDELPRQVSTDAGVTAPTRVVPARADQFLVAMRGGEAISRNALAMPAGNLLVREFAVPGGVAVHAGAIGETQALGPDTAVDDPDDDTLTGAAHAAELRPEAARCVESEEGGGGGRVLRGGLVLGDRYDARHARQGCGLLGRHLGREAVEAVAVVVDLAATGLGGDIRVALVEVGGVVDHHLRVGVDLLAFPGCGGLEPRDVALIGHHGGFGHLHDVEVVLRGALRFGLALAPGRRGGHEDGSESGQGQGAGNAGHAVFHGVPCSSCGQRGACHNAIFAPCERVWCNKTDLCVGI